MASNAENVSIWWRHHAIHNKTYDHDFCIRSEHYISDHPMITYLYIKVHYYVHIHMVIRNAWYILYYIILYYVILHYIILYLCNVSVLFILHGKLFEINLHTYLSTWQIAYILISCLSRPFQLLIFIGCVYVIHTEMCGRKYNLQVLYRTLPLEFTCFTETVGVALYT